MSVFNVNHMTDQMWLLHFKYTEVSKATFKSFKIQGLFKDWTSKDEDNDKDLKLVLKESLRTSDKDND